ncbi:F510_1955 family glycosylhydrolase [Ureibacillus sp. MALMAid1270]|uniref:F510_1955 family glycosylhydrolase n=1 Tax=Ureibacillus sp. MALMAid1270 TaxID=3411629 RepID=UPI003BA44987
MKKFTMIFSLSIVVLVLTACSSSGNIEFQYEKVTNNQIDHIHGAGYINGEDDVVIATHTGLYSYGEEGWKEANAQKHDYMGFQAVSDGFYASGHPGQGSDLENPFGLIKSTDKGASFEKLAFYGEIDFHYLAAGYNSNSIYVFNEMPTEKLQSGLHYSTDEGKTWSSSALNGFESSYLSNFAAHPSKDERLVVGSNDGLYISEDFGQNVEKLNSTSMISYVTLTESGGYYTNFDDSNVYLKSFTFESAKENEISLPVEIMKDPIIFIASNPNNSEEITIVTNNLNIYLTKDNGLNWQKLASNGELTK